MRTRISLTIILISLILCANAQTDPILTRDTLMTSGFLNPVTNKLYIANQGYSNITEVECDPEVLTLKSGYTWFSLPRLDRTYNNGVPINPVFLNPDNIVPNYLTIMHENKTWHFDGNSGTGTLTTLFSTDGYKANNQTLTTGFIYLNGTILDPETEIQLTDQHENWIGYFLTKPLPIEEAFGDVFDKVSIIKTQHWTITRPNPNDPPIETTGIQGGVLEYGDMVAVTMFEPATLVWNDQGTSVPIPILDAPQAFSFEEEEDYTPVAIILDPQDNPTEVAVYSNDICQGASVVYGDTVMVQAYLDNISKGDDTLEIVRYYGQSKTINKTTKYAVLNHRTGFMEPRVAQERDEQPFYVISLEKQAAAGIENSEIMKFSVYPNPTKGDIHIEGFATEGNTISCTLSRPDGSFNMEIYKNAIDSGTFRTTIHPDVAPGIYLITLTDGTHTKTEKIVIL